MLRKLTTAVMVMIVRYLMDQVMMDSPTVMQIAKHTKVDDSSLISQVPTLCLLVATVIGVVRRLCKKSRSSVKVIVPSRRPSHIITGNLRSSDSFCNLRKRQSRHRPWCQRRNRDENLLKTIEQSIESLATRSSSASSVYNDTNSIGTGYDPAGNDTNLVDRSDIVDVKSSASMIGDKMNANLDQYQDKYHHAGYGDYNGAKQNEETLSEPKRMLISRKTRSGKVYSYLV